MTADGTAQTFARYRNYLFSIAYRMLGSASDAEDVVQEAFIRWLKVEEKAVDSPKAYLAAIVTRMCIDHLRSARIRREQYIGPWLPEPILTGSSPGLVESVDQRESISYAFLVLLEKLDPLERAIFLMREVFEYPYAEIAEMVEKSEASCRQIFHRAQGRLEQRQPRFEVPYQKKEQMTELFLRASIQGELPELLDMLSDDIVFTADSGGKVPAGLKPLRGKDKVVRGMEGFLRPLLSSLQARLAQVNGQPAIVGYVGGRLYGVVFLNWDGEQVREIFAVLNPDKLHGVEGI